MTAEPEPNSSSQASSDVTLLSSGSTPQNALSMILDRAGALEEAVQATNSRDSEDRKADEPMGEARHDSRMSCLPSPPLTRVGSNDSIRIHAAQEGNQDNTVIDDGRKDDTRWHPLTEENAFTSDSPAMFDIGREEEGVPERTADGPSPHIQRSNRFIVAKAPSPQPWDLVEPPLDHNEHEPDIYSTVGSKFNTLQSGSSQRPLKPKSSYYFGPPPTDAAYGTAPIGQIGVHHPREVLRVERDYSGGELIQFAPIYPLELDGRVTPTQFLESINAINELLISAHSAKHSLVENLLAVFTLQISRLFLMSHYEKIMRQLKDLIEELNVELFNPTGLNILWPRKAAFLFLEIEYY